MLGLSNLRVGVERNVIFLRQLKKQAVCFTIWMELALYKDIYPEFVLSLFCRMMGPKWGTLPEEIMA